MNRLKSIIYLTLILSVIPTGIFAQPDEQMQRFREEKISFFNENLDLSEQQAKAFWPVYEDLNNRIMKINEDEKSLFNYILSNYDNLTDSEVDRNISKYHDLHQKRFELNSQYHDKFVDIIGEKKTLKMYALERDFRMHLLRRFRGGGGRGTGPGQGRRFN